MPPAADAPRALRAPLHRRLLASATERLSLKAAALFFACVLWLVVSAEEPAEQVVEVVVSPRMDSTLVVVGRLPVVRALVVGRAREVFKLSGETPVVRPTIEGVVRDSVRVAVRVEDVELPPDAQVLVRELRPRFVTVHVARTARPAPPATPAESALAGLSVGGRAPDGLPVTVTSPAPRPGASRVTP